MKSIADLEQDLSSQDWDVALAASDALAQIGGQEALDVLIPLLSSESGVTRNAAALALRDIRDDQAVEPLVRAISDPRNRNNRGTMVYALETLDCRHLFHFLFDLALQGDFECRCHALNILSEQQFMVSDEGIVEARKKLDRYTSLGRQDPETLVGELSAILESLRERGRDVC